MSEFNVENTPNRSRATFIIQGESLDLDAISTELKLVPTHTHSKGEVNRLKQEFPHDMWALTAPVPDIEPLDSHIMWLRRNLEPSFDFIISMRINAEVYIYCGYTTDREQSSFTLSPEALAMSVRLGIPMEVSILSI